MNRIQFAWVLLCVSSLACAQDNSIRQLGRLKSKDIKESSGLVVSRTQPGILWTHNDGGGSKRQILYAVTRTGESVASFPVIGVEMSDWEDLAADEKGNLYLGDIGNNDAVRRRLYVHCIGEPKAREGKVELKPESSWELRFPAQPFDCESLFIHGQFGYVISKLFNDRQAAIYRFPLATTAQPVVLERVSELPVTSPVCGADLTADGQLLGLVSKSWVYVFTLNGDLAGANRAKHHRVKAPNKDLEGCSFDADGLLATAESKQIFIFSLKAFAP